MTDSPSFVDNLVAQQASQQATQMQVTGVEPNGVFGSKAIVDLVRRFGKDNNIEGMDKIADGFGKILEALDLFDTKQMLGLSSALHHAPGGWLTDKLSHAFASVATVKMSMESLGQVATSLQQTLSPIVGQMTQQLEQQIAAQQQQQPQMAM